MGKVVLGMPMSVDGFVNDSSGSVEALYPDLATLPNTEPLSDAIRNTGAVVMGRNTFAMADDPDSYAGNYEFQVPIFVLTHEAPKSLPKQTDKLTFTFVTDGIERAIEQAKAAAGERDVTVISGASTAQQCIRAGLVDELDIDTSCRFSFAAGLRPFDDLGSEWIRLERMNVVESPAGRTHVRYRLG